jgi:hypothetical protein
MNEAISQGDVMSWEVINEMLGLALVDHEFCQQFLVDPLAAACAHAFDLTPQEQEMLAKIGTHDLYEFGHTLLSLLASWEES